MKRDHFLISSGCALAGVVGTSTSSFAQFSKATATITITRSEHDGEVPKALAGLSYEKSLLPANFFKSDNTALVRCFSNLGKSLVRIGGNSADVSKWVPNGTGDWRGHISPPDLFALNGFLQATGWNVLYGINLGKNTAAEAAAEAAYVARALGSNLYGFEIGNEADLYTKHSVRAATYAPGDFFAEWSQYADAVRQSVPSAVLTGPASAANVETWTKQFAADAGSQVKLLTQHYYRGDGKNQNTTMTAMLSDDRYLRKILVTLRDTAIKNHIAGYRLTEANSYYNGGASGISDAHGAALWAIDFLMTNAQLSSAGANFHGGDNIYTPIADVNGEVAGVKPIYYGMLLVSQMSTGPMLKVNVETELLLSAYATAGDNGATDVVVVNKDPETTAEIKIELGSPGSQATALKLLGHGLSATSGTTLGGSSVASNGEWIPLPQASRMHQVNGTTLMIDVPPASALLIKVT